MIRVFQGSKGRGTATSADEAAKERKDIQEIIQEESERGRVSCEEVMKGSRRRQVSKTRVEIAIRCREELGLSGAEIARHLGVNTTSINRALEKRRKL